MKIVAQIFLSCALIFTAAEFVKSQSETFSIQDYYQLRAGNEWRYTAPPERKEGDYVSRMTTGETVPLKLQSDSNKQPKQTITIRHFDATKAAKVLALVKGKGLYYLREEFTSGESYADFDNAVLWFPVKFKIGEETSATTGFTRIYKNGKTDRGTFQLTQKIIGLEEVTTTAGVFSNSLRVEFQTAWQFGDGRRARSENVYHYVKNVGVVKASARFIIYDAAGKEVINRLVETDLKSAQVNGKDATK